MGALQRRALPGGGEAIEGELAQRLQQAQPGSCARRLTGPRVRLDLAPDEAVVDQRLQTVEGLDRQPATGRADGDGRLDGAAPGEDGQAPEQGPLVHGQQVVAPGDGRFQRLVALGQIARAAGEQGQGAGEAGQDVLGREQAGTGGGQLDGQRQSVEAPADV